MSSRSDSTKTKINLITHHMSHHANASGYDRLIDYIDGRIITTPHKLRFTQKVIGKVFRKQINGAGLLWYHTPSFITEMAAAKIWLTQSDQIFHFLYGENCFRYLGVLKRLRRSNSIVCTYHTPAERFDEVVRDKRHLANLDGIIVVSTIQQEFLARFITPNRIFFVPHGIDTHVYAPPPAKTRDEYIRCAFVGSHMRDFETLAKAARLLSDWNKPVLFDVVTKRDHHSHFAGLENVKLHSSVSDEALINIYHTSDLLALPLINSTANNSLLEAMACGLPVISTDLPGVRDYVDDNTAVLLSRGDAPALAEAIVGLSEDHERRLALAKLSREQACRFDWANIAKQTQNVYAAIHNRTSGD